MYSVILDAETHTKTQLIVLRRFGTHGQYHYQIQTVQTLQVTIKVPCLAFIDNN